MNKIGILLLCSVLLQPLAAMNKRPLDSGADSSVAQRVQAAPAVQDRIRCSVEGYEKRLNEPVACPYCKKNGVALAVGNVDALAVHIRKECQYADRLEKHNAYLCPLCLDVTGKSAKFSRRKELVLKHGESFHAGITQRCDICGADVKDLQRHQLETHRPELPEDLEIAREQEREQKKLLVQQQMEQEREQKRLLAEQLRERELCKYTAGECGAKLEESIVCPYCKGHTADGVRELAKHIRQCGSADKSAKVFSYICSLCCEENKICRRASLKELFELHIKPAHCGIKQQCPHCHVQVVHMQQHVKKVHLEAYEAEKKARLERRRTVKQQHVAGPSDALANLDESEAEQDESETELALDKRDKEAANALINLRRVL